MDMEELMIGLEILGKSLIDYYFERMLGVRPEKKIIFPKTNMEETKTYTKVPDGTPKIDPNKIFSFRNSKGELQVCEDYMDYKGCGNFLSWDLRPGRNTPLHVNQDGKILGNGNCPNR